MAVKLDPWGHFAIQEYEKLFSQFGIEPIDNIRDRELLNHHFFKRKIVFGHRDFNVWLNALKKGEKVAILTGLMPSGHVHLGHLMVFEELRFFQQLGAKINIVVADAEAYAVRRLSREKIMEYAREYILFALASGLNPDKTRIYFQTRSDTIYYRLIQMFSRKVTLAELEAIYGKLEPSKIMAALTQAADILHLQLPQYGGYKYILVPVGADQDPHLRLSRDIADRFEKELGLKRPASTYHKFIRGLDGNKMSSSKPDFAIFLSDPP
ncbi:MAG: tryptophan--tRNA ligase, partial [Desulfurococcales archaeon]|nr:tryptophan--tRNA ligase [Desulfurococcales archaeon]